MTIADDLLAARALLESKGRSRKGFEDKGGRITLWQAVHEVTGTGSDRGELVCRALLEHTTDDIRCALRDIDRNCEPGYNQRVMIMAAVSFFDDKYAMCDQDVFDLIDRTLADTRLMRRLQMKVRS